MPVHASKGRSKQRPESRFAKAFQEGRSRTEARRARNGGRQPWVTRKMAVGIAIALICYTYYVYVATHCVPMIKREASALGGRSLGIALLVVFNVLWLMFVWSYGTVVLTSPGFAVKEVAQSSPPVPTTSPSQHHYPPSPTDSETDIDPVSSPPYSNGGQTSTFRMNSQDTQARPADAIPAVAATHTNSRRDPSRPAPAHLRQTEAVSSIQPTTTDDDLPPSAFSRLPPTHPVLAPEYRYCMKDGIVKPWRTHHCRACGTCVMKYDHHCPWIGQCVGMWNQKFFINFLTWATTFTLYIFISIVIPLARRSPNSPNPQHIVILVLSALFSVFTSALLLTQMRLVLLNMTTVEQIRMQNMHERESSLLSEIVPCPCTGSCSPSYAEGRRWDADMPGVEKQSTPCGVVVERRKLRQEWDREWGRIEVEGNLWWAGSKKRNWVEVMGKNPLGWFLPIGRSLGDGKTFPRNPRFDEGGRWRRRKDWPEELRNQ